jgi:putative hydrolase of the HAD superfamily
MEKILRLRLDDFVDPNLIFITDQVGIAKSNPKLYRLAVRAAGVKPHQAMHVGDHPLSDVQSAKKAGLIAVWHRGAGKYTHLLSANKPDHEIRSLEELRPILQEVYGIL